VYFLPENSLELDKITNKIYGLYNDLTYLFYSVQKALNFMPVLSSVSYPKTVNSYTPNFNTHKDIEISFGILNNDTYVQIKGLSLLTPGFIYIGISEESDSSPGFYELRHGVDKGGNRLLGSFMEFVEKEEAELAYNFTGLGNNTVYQVFYAASEENPGRFVNFIEVNSLSINTTFEVINGGLRMISGKISWWLLLLYLLFFLFK